MGKSQNGKELGKGISQRPDGTYRGRFTNRFGVRQEVYDRNLNELRKKMRQAQADDDRQSNIADPNMTLDEWFHIWMKTCKQNCRDTTKRTYEVQYNRLKPELGWRKLKDLNLIVMQQAFNNLKSDASRKHCKSVLTDILNRAVASDLLVKHYAWSIKVHLDNVEPEEKRILSDKEVELLLETAKKMRSTLYPIFVIALETGMRIGEILGLTWDDVDFSTNTIHVRHTLAYLRNDGITAIYKLHPPKTSAGRRDIPMTKNVKTALLHQKIRCNRINTKHEPIIENLVFISNTNHPINETNIRGAIRNMMKKIHEKDPGFEHFTMHGLRHTFATNCIAKGMKPKTLQKLLGHGSFKMTMDLYTHVTDETAREEMSLMGAMA